MVLMNMSNQVFYLLLFIENPFFKLIRNYYYSNWLRLPRPVQQHHYGAIKEDSPRRRQKKSLIYQSIRIFKQNEICFVIMVDLMSLVHLLCFNFIL